MTKSSHKGKKDKKQSKKSDKTHSKIPKALSTVVTVPSVQLQKLTDSLFDGAEYQVESTMMKLRPSSMSLRVDESIIGETDRLMIYLRHVEIPKSEKKKLQSSKKRLIQLPAITESYSERMRVLITAETYSDLVSRINSCVLNSFMGSDGNAISPDEFKNELPGAFHEARKLSIKWRNRSSIYKWTSLATLVLGFGTFISLGCALAAGTGEGLFLLFLLGLLPTLIGFFILLSLGKKYQKSRKTIKRISETKIGTIPSTQLIQPLIHTLADINVKLAHEGLSLRLLTPVDDIKRMGVDGAWFNVAISIERLSSEGSAPIYPGYVDLSHETTSLDEHSKNNQIQSNPAEKKSAFDLSSASSIASNAPLPGAPMITEEMPQASTQGPLAPIQTPTDYLYGSMMGPMGSDASFVN